MIHCGDDASVFLRGLRPARCRVACEHRKDISVISDRYQGERQLDIKHFRFLIALTREKHFGRAANACFVSQPTLSARIRQLEDDLGILIVERGSHAYKGLTPEGERVLHWAKRIVGDVDAMRQDVSAMQNELSGTMTIGVIPSALALAPLVTLPFHEAHPGVAIKVLSRSSIEIQRGLDNIDFDAGITYIDNEPLKNVRELPLYVERYVLVVREGSALASKSTISWREASGIPLCLLTNDMQNRRIINRAFQDIGETVEPAFETNSIVNLVTHVRLGPVATILPESFTDNMGIDHSIRAIPLVDPDVAHTIGLVAADRDPPSPISRALFSIADSLDVQPDAIQSAIGIHAS